MSESTPASSPADREVLFAEICREHTGLLARVVHSFAIERVDRDDLGQEILIALWEALRASTPGPASPLMFTAWP